MKRFAPLLLLAGCATYGVPIDRLSQADDESFVSVIGRLHMPLDQDGNFQLCLENASVSASESDACVDLVAPQSLDAALASAQETCVVAKGKFLAFGPNRVGLGNLHSNIGLLEVGGISRCNTWK